MSGQDARSAASVYLLTSILWDDFEVHSAFVKEEDAEQARQAANEAQKRKTYKRAYVVEEVELHS